MNRGKVLNVSRVVTAILSAILFAAFTVVSTMTASAADSWETWPKKTAEPGIGDRQANSGGAANAGESGGTKTAEGISAGTIGWIALGAAAVIGIGIAAGGGGGGSTTPAHH